jgi:hypothetical protein
LLPIHFSKFCLLSQTVDWDSCVRTCRDRKVQKETVGRVCVPIITPWLTQVLNIRSYSDSLLKLYLGFYPLPGFTKIITFCRCFCFCICLQVNKIQKNTYSVRPLMWAAFKPRVQYGLRIAIWGPQQSTFSFASCSPEDRYRTNLGNTEVLINFDDADRVQNNKRVVFSWVWYYVPQWHGVTSQKIILFKITAVRTSNPTPKIILSTVSHHPEKSFNLIYSVCISFCRYIQA